MDSLITIPVLNNVNIPVNIRATLGNLVRQQGDDDGNKMDSNLLVQSLHQHGTPLLRWLEAEQREHLPQSVIDRAYRNEFASSRGSELGDATFNVRLNQFIARKADILFQRQPQIHHEVQPVPIDDTYAIMPPLESFMGVPAQHCRQHFFKSIEKGDVLVGVVTAVMDSGLVIQILCMDNEKVRDLDSLKIMAFCPANEITQLHKHFNPTENFQIQDLVKGVVILVTAESEKVVLSLHNSRMAGLADITLGLITEEQFPVHYRRRLAVKGLTFEELLESILGFKNPGSLKYLTEFHRLQDRETYMRSLISLEIPEQEYAENVRKLQSARKAHQSVLQGVTLFKQGNYLEAMQHLNRALQIDEKNVEGLVARGALYANKESYSRAIEDFEEALKEDPHHVNAYTYLVETLLALAKQHEERKEWTDAEEAYIRVLSIYPEHPEATADLRIVQQKKHQPTSSQFEKFDAIADSFMDLIEERKPGEKSNRRSWSSSSDDRSPGRRRSGYNRKDSRSPDSKYRRKHSRDRSWSTEKSRSRRSRSMDSRKDKRKDSKKRKSKSPNSKRGENKSPESIKDRRKSKSSPGKSTEKSKKKKKDTRRNEDEEKSKKKKNKSKSPSPSNTTKFQKPTLKLKSDSELETPKKKVLTSDKGHESSSPEWGERPSTLHITRTRTNSFDEDEYLYGDSAIGYEKETFKSFPGFQEDSLTKTQNEEVLFEDRKSPEKSPPRSKESRDRRKEREILKLKSFDEESNSRSPRDKRSKSRSPDQDRSRDNRDPERERSITGKERSRSKRDRSRDDSDSDRSRNRSSKVDKLQEKSKKSRDKYKSPERQIKETSYDGDTKSKSDKKYSKKKRDSVSPVSRRSRSRSTSDERPSVSKRRSSPDEGLSRSKRRSSPDEGLSKSKRRSSPDEGLSRSIRRSSPDEGLSRSKRRSSPDEGLSKSKRRSSPDEGLSKSKRRSSPDEGLSKSKRRSSPEEGPSRSKRRSSPDEGLSRSRRRSRSDDHPSRSRRRSSSDEPDKKPKNSKKNLGDHVFSQSHEDKKPIKTKSGSKDEMKKIEKESSAGTKIRRSRWDKSPDSNPNLADESSRDNEKEDKGGWKEVEVVKGSSILHPDPPKESDMFSGSITRTVYRTPKVAEVKPTQVVEPMKSKPSFFLPRQIVISKKTDGASAKSESRIDRSSSRSRSRSESTDGEGKRSSREVHSQRSPGKSRDRSQSKESFTSHKTDRSRRLSEVPPRRKNKDRSTSRDRSRHFSDSRSKSRDRNPDSLPSSRDHKKRAVESRSKFRSRSRSVEIEKWARSLGPRRTIGLGDRNLGGKGERRKSDHRAKSESGNESDSHQSGRKNKSTKRLKSRSRSRERSGRYYPDNSQKQRGKDRSRNRDSHRSDSDDSPQPKHRDESIRSSKSQRNPGSSRKNRESYTEHKKDHNRRSFSPDDRKSTSSFKRDDGSSPETPRKRDQTPNKNSEGKKGSWKRRDSRSPVRYRNESGKRSRSRSSSSDDDRYTSSKPKPAKRQFSESKKDKSGKQPDPKVKTPTKSPGGKNITKFTETESESKYKRMGRQRSSSSSLSRTPSPSRRDFPDRGSPPMAVKSKWDSSPKASRWEPPAQPQAKRFTFKPVGSPTAKNTLTQLETFLLELKQKKKQGDEETSK